MKQEKKTIHSYLQELDSEDQDMEVMEMITQEEMATGKVLTKKIQINLASKDHLLDETQMVVMMETVETMMMTTMTLWSQPLTDTL